MIKKLWIAVMFLSIATVALFAASKEVLDIEVRGTIKKFEQQINGGSEFLKKAAGYLVFPNVYKAGFGIGGEYGEGALVVHGKIVGYYNTVSASFGWQIGAQKKSIVIVFLTQKALEAFRHSDGWKIGADASVAIAKWGAGEDINTIEFKEPVVAFIFGNKGLMYNLTLEGSKITKIKK